jgi:hypothetical protein
MVDILHRVGIAAPPEKVFAALTTIDGIRGWWISAADGSASEGEAFAFRRNHLDVIEAKQNLTCLRTFLSRFPRSVVPYVKHRRRPA